MAKPSDVSSIKAISHHLHRINGEFGILSLRAQKDAPWLNPAMAAIHEWYGSYQQARETRSLNALKIRRLQENIPALLASLQEARNQAQRRKEASIHDSIGVISETLEEIRQTDAKALASKTYTLELYRYISPVDSLVYHTQDEAEKFQKKWEESGQHHELRVEVDSPQINGGQVNNRPMAIMDYFKVIEAVKLLLHNAYVHGTREGPTIVRFSLEKDGKPISTDSEIPDNFGIRISVSSTGKPISHASAQAIMKGELTTSREDGLEHGLGMRYVMGLVRGHGGNLSIESEREGPHHRNVFSILLPRIPKDVEEIWKKSGSYSPREGYPRSVEI